MNKIRKPSPSGLGRRHPIPRPCFTSLFIVLFVVPISPSTLAQSVAVLVPGQNLNARIEAGAAARFRLDLARDTFFEIRASSTEFDVVATLVRPDGSTHSTVDLTAPPDPEIVLGVADATGAWALEIRGAASDESGSFNLVWRENRAADDNDRLHAKSRLAWLNAVQAGANGDAATSVKLMEESIRLFEQLGEGSPELASRLQSLASALLSQAEFDRAEEVQRRALDLRRKLKRDDWLDLGIGFGQLAMALQGQQRYSDAIDSMRESVRYLEKLDSSDPEQLVQAYGGLAALLYQQANYAEAREAFLHAAQLLRQSGKPAGPTLAMVLNNLGATEESLEDFKAAEATYRQALKVGEDIFGPDHEQVAMTLNNLGYLFDRLGRYPEAREAWQRSATILENRLGPRDPNLAIVLNSLAVLDKTQGRYEEAEALYQRVKEIFLETRGETNEDTAGVLGNLGELYVAQGRFTEAAPLFERALGILRQVAGEEHPLTANALNNLADLYRSLGRHDEAERLFQRSIAIYTAKLGPDSVETIPPRSNLASLYVEQGRYADAEVTLSRLAQSTETILGPQHPLLATTLNNLGNVYLEQGRMEDAETEFKRALDIWTANYGRDHAKVAVATQNLARTYFETGRFEEAESLMNRALRIRQAVLDTNHPDIAGSLDFRGDFHLDRGNLKAAADDYRSSLQLLTATFGPDHPRVGAESGKLGRALFQMGERTEARQRLKRAIEILSQGSFPEAWIRNQSALARLEREDGNPELAIQLLAQALAKAERQRPSIGGGERTRAAFLERVSGEFDLMVGWQIEAGRESTAFEYAERSRARALLDQLSLSGIDLRKSLPAELKADLLGRESKARAEVAEFQRRIVFLGSRHDLDPSERDRRIRELEERLRAADQEFERVYEEIKSGSPLWTKLITSANETASLETVRGELVSQDRALLLYQLGDQESYLFLVSPDEPALETFSLQLDKDAEQAGVQSGPLTISKLSQLLGADDTGGINIVSQLAQFPRLSRLVARALVPPAAWTRIRDRREIVLIPDGVLYFLPFEMLQTGGSTNLDEPVYWLDSGPVIRYASSATTLLNLERRPSHPLRGVLSLSDAKFQMPREPDSTPAGPLERGMMGPKLAELPGTARESDLVRLAFPKARVLQRKDATEANLRRALHGRALLHLATHGLVDETRNGLFSALALTQPEQMTDSDNDGFLQLYEIYELDLSGVELSVLSACQTNVGVHGFSDGVFGLSRGFLAAGARRVIASQWRVDDESTAELVGSFFQLLADHLKNAEAVDYARTLRQAKMKIRRTPRWRSPVYWAPLIILGAR